MKKDVKLFKLDKSEIQKIIEKGYTYVTFPNGQIKKITVDDLIVPKKELDKLLNLTSYAHPE